MFRLEEFLVYEYNIFFRVLHHPNSTIFKIGFILAQLETTTMRVSPMSLESPGILIGKSGRRYEVKECFSVDRIDRANNNIVRWPRKTRSSFNTTTKIVPFVVESVILGIAICKMQRTCKSVDIHCWPKVSEHKNTLILIVFQYVKVHYFWINTYKYRN